MTTRFRTLLFLLIWAIALLPITSSASVGVDEKKAARIKAAYLYHLARLSEWPAESMIANNDSIKICVVGEDVNDLAGYFRSQAIEFAAGNHPFSVDYVSDSAKLLNQDLTASDQLSGYHILFFTKSEQSNYLDILKAIRSTCILTTSEIEGFPSAGGMVGFVLKGNRIQIEVNNQVVSEANLKISAEFLQHAKIIK